MGNEMACTLGGMISERQELLILYLALSRPETYISRWEKG